MPWLIFLVAALFLHCNVQARSGYSSIFLVAALFLHYDGQARSVYSSIFLVAALFLRCDVQARSDLLMSRPFTSLLY